MDAQELRDLTKAARRRPLWIPDSRALRVSIGREDIHRILPHREPFLFVDEITEVGLEHQAIQGRRFVDPADPVFLGHFPGDPIYPGVLQLEMIGQLGLCLLHFLSAGSAEITLETRPRSVRALKVHAAHFLAPVRPGSDLTMVARVIRSDDYTAVCAGQVLWCGTICSYGVLEAYIVGE